MDKFLFLDLDETLVSSLYADSEKHADQLLDMYGDGYHGIKYSILEGTAWDLKSYWYVSFVRPWTYKFLEEMREEYGVENVGILSWGESGYVQTVNKLLKLDIPPSNIYAGEDDMRSCVPRFKNMNVVLVDNESYSYHRKRSINKYNFLFCPDPEKFVQVMNFDVRHFQERLDITLKELKEKIDKAFKHENK